MALPTVLDEIDRLFDELVRRPWGATRSLVPAEIHEVEDGWVIEMPSEGMRAEDLKIEVRGRRLLVTGSMQRQEQFATHGSGWTRSRQAVVFERTVTLPGDVNAAGIEAAIKGSRLTIRVPRRRP